MSPLFGRRHRPALVGQADYEFAFTTGSAAALAVLGIRPGTSRVRVENEELDVRFGPWRVRTPMANVASAEPSGPLAWVRAFGVRLSLVDRGLTFGSSTEGGVCIRFHDPVTGLEPFGLLRHPSLTVTVATPELLLTRLRRSISMPPPAPRPPDPSIRTSSQPKAPTPGRQNP
jgi:hypothetical protein